MEQTKLVEFRMDDNLVAVELKYKFDKEQLYFFDEQHNEWVLMNVSAIVKRNILTVENPAALLK